MTGRTTPWFSPWIVACFAGCGPLYTLANPSEVNRNRDIIHELTTLIDKQPLEFLTRVDLDTESLAHDVEPLGFGCAVEHGAYRHNDQICRVSAIHAARARVCRSTRSRPGITAVLPHAATHQATSHAPAQPRPVFDI